MCKLATKFQGLEETYSWLKGLGEKICNLLLGLSFSQAQRANRLEEVAG
jgi:hypothetical protein